MIYPTIMCGGIGSRLWPLSRPERPKQFLCLLDDRRSLLEATLDRLGPMQASSGAGNGTGPAWHPPTVICNAAHADLTRVALAAAALEGGAVLGEPSGRNTAAAAALAAHHALDRHRAEDDDAFVLLLPADHHVARPDLLGAAVGAAAELARAGNLVTFGVRPDRPETGYGYIERGEPLEVGFRIARFTEKPDIDRARAYLAGGRHHWNAGIFLYGATWFLNEMEKLCPEIALPVADAWRRRRQDGPTLVPDADGWEMVPSTSIDYAVAEKTDSGVIVPVDIGWSDIGSWESVHRLSSQDGAGNSSSGVELVASDSHGCHVHGDTGREIVLLGVSDLVVVDTGEAVLVMRRSAAERLGDLRRVPPPPGR